MAAIQISFSELKGHIHTAIAAFNAQIEDFGFANDDLMICVCEPGLGKVIKIAAESSKNLQFTLQADEDNITNTVYLVANVHLADKLDEIISELTISPSAVIYRVDHDLETLARYRGLYLGDELK